MVDKTSLFHHNSSFSIPRPCAKTKTRTKTKTKTQTKTKTKTKAKTTYPECRCSKRGFGTYKTRQDKSKIDKFKTSSKQVHKKPKSKRINDKTGCGKDNMSNGASHR